MEDWLIEFVKMKGLINKKSDRLIREKKFRCEAPLGWNYVIGLFIFGMSSGKKGLFWTPRLFNFPGQGHFSLSVRARARRQRSMMLVVHTAGYGCRM